MGVQLFHAAEGGIPLTEYGEIFLKYAQKHLSDHADMVQEIEALRRSKSGNMRMAVSTGLFNIIPRDIAEKFARFSQTGARVSAVRSVVDNDCESGLANGAWDFALLNTPVDRSRFAAEPLHKDHLFLWAPSNSNLARRESAVLKDLAGQTIVVLTPDEYITTKGYVKRLADELNCEVHFADEMIGVLELAMELDAFAVSPRTPTHWLLQKRGIRPSHSLMSYGASHSAGVWTRTSTSMKASSSSSCVNSGSFTASNIPSTEKYCSQKPRPPRQQ